MRPGPSKSPQVATFQPRQFPPAAWSRLPPKAADWQLKELYSADRNYGEAERLYKEATTVARPKNLAGGYYADAFDHYSTLMCVICTESRAPLLSLKECSELGRSFKLVKTATCLCLAFIWSTVEEENTGQ